MLCAESTWGWAVGDVAESGAGALGNEALRAGTFDFVLVDLGLPDMNGREVLERARAIGLPSTPCFIMMTGLWSPAEAARAKEAGYAYVLQKPFDDAQLLTILRREKK